MIIDPLFLIIVGPAFLLALWAQYKVKSTFNKYSEIGTSSGMTGAEVAQSILDGNGIRDVTVEAVDGFLSDHYDPSAKALRLSPGVYHGRSQASVGVAAHEVGHAIQHAQNYAWLGMRSALVPVVHLGSTLAMPLFVIGLILSSAKMMIAGAIAFGAVALFQIITLPVEFDASSRALAEVERLGLLHSDELVGARKVLNAAALTYVAAAIQSVLTLVYFILRAQAVDD